MKSPFSLAISGFSLREPPHPTAPPRGKNAELGPCDDPVAFAQFAGILHLGLVTLGFFHGKSMANIWGISINVNPGLINHGLLIRGYSSNSHNPILKWYPPQLNSLGVY